MSAQNESVCEMCGEKCTKYRCPRCLRKTCSLICVKRHKVKYSCNGVRDKTAYVAMEEFNDNTMLSDYRFLESASLLADLVSQDNKSPRKQLKKQATLLLKNSLSSGVKLQFMPIGFTKRAENSSWFNIRKLKRTLRDSWSIVVHSRAIKRLKKKCIEWRVKWIFPQAKIEYVDQRVSEKKTLTELLKKYVDANEGDPVYKQRLKLYRQVPTSELSVFIKRENQPINQPSYHQLVVTQTLQEGLHGQIIIEFPTLHVVLPDKTADYISEQLSSGKRKLSEVEESDLQNKRCCSNGDEP